ncbi:uncharacterized protein [Nicotiana sylvestris]|uniref:CCHC-type domain-containing protein n=2 Tax=Nicotiana TaxID=4085 RepID=A0A1S3XH80_TOBAC|nr:PREDICTED: uncharacterized protein LOC104236230 isoform X1 [Nicotiana sylvestris]XP_009788415.1 PREDICTED: uncharacterized protein LOC104236230 isoform X1 [Nicotiana sylvestris]XP_016439199.1 PREDICTED: uncharacterized protein LOC107765106 [Nicotiana tabacum]
MTCGFCGTTGHNRRKCPLANGEGTSQTVQDVPLTAPQDSQNLEFAFMPTSGMRMTSPEPSSQFDGLQNTLQQSVAPSILADDEYEGGYEDEDEEPYVMSKVISEAMTRLQQRKLHQEPIGTRKIAFKGDIDGVNVPTDLPYSPKKLTWKGKSAMSSSQLVAEKEKKIGKLKTKKAKH